MYAAAVGIEAIALPGEDAYGWFSFDDPDLQDVIVVEEELGVFYPYVLFKRGLKVTEVEGHDGLSFCCCRPSRVEQIVDTFRIDERGGRSFYGDPVALTGIVISVTDGGNEQDYAAGAGYAPEQECKYFFYVYPCGQLFFLFLLAPPNGPADRQTGTTVSVQHGQ